MTPTQFELAKKLWNFSFDNPEKIKPVHIAIYFFAVEHCNRLGWKEKFGLPTSLVMEGTGLKSYNIYKKHFDDLVAWKMFDAIEYAKNQYRSNVIAFARNDEAAVKQTIKQRGKHSKSKGESTSERTGESSVQSMCESETTVQSTSESAEQSSVQSSGESTEQSTGSIDKLLTKELLTIQPLSTLKEKNDDAGEEVKIYENLEKFKKRALANSMFGMTICQKGIKPELLPKWLDAFHRRLIFIGDTLKSEIDYRKHFPTWLVKIPRYRTMNPDDYSPAKDAEIPIAIGTEYTLTDSERAILERYPMR